MDESNRLKDWLESNNLIYCDSISSLQGVRVGIDAMRWLRSLGFGKKAPLQPAMGGVPFTLEDTIDKELEKFRKAEIEPVFVFNGIRFNSRFPPSLLTAATQRGEAWRKYETQETEKPEFKSDVTNAPEFVTRVFGYLISQKVQAIRAPYYAWTQLVYLAQEGLVQAIYTSLVALTTNLGKNARLLIDIDFKKQQFKWIAQDRALSAAGVDLDRFLEAFLLCKCDPIMRSFPKNKLHFSETLYHLNKFGFDFVVHMVLDQSEYIKLAEHKAKLIEAIRHFKNQLIFNKDCQISLLTKSQVPSGWMFLNIGPRLPNDIYYLLLQGIIPEYILNILVSRKLVEPAPLAPTHEYSSMVKDLLTLRMDALKFVADSFNPEFNRSIVIKTWWDDNEIEYSFREFDTTMPWFIAPDDMKNAFNRARKTDRNRNVLNIDLGFLITYKPSLSFKPNHIIKTPDELYASITLHVLFHLGYYEQHQQHQQHGRKSPRRPSVRPTRWLQALNQPQDPEFAEQRLLILQLIRHNVFSLKSWKPFPNDSIETDSPEILILSRVFSLITVSTEPREWKENVDFDTMAFNSIARKMQQTMRSLVESLLVSRFRSGRLRIPWKTLQQLSHSLPFHRMSSTALGIVLKTALMHPKDMDSIDALSRRFPSCGGGIDNDMRRGYKFWKQVVGMVRFLSNKDRTYDSLYRVMEKADALLEQHKRRLGI